MKHKIDMIKTISGFFVLFAMFSISIEMFIMVTICFIAISFFCLTALNYWEGEKLYKKYVKKFIKSKCIKDQVKLRKIQSDFENK